MGQKVNPTIFRIGTTTNWKSRWFTSKVNFKNFLKEDLILRQLILEKFSEAGIGKIEIERNARQILILIHTSRPGILIGRGGKGIENIKNLATKIVKGKTIDIEIIEITQPELSSAIVADNIAKQIEQRIPYKKAVKQAIERAMAANALGIKIKIKGRLSGAEIARSETFSQGKIPLHTIRADIDFSQEFAKTTYGTVGIKVWIYKGEVFKEKF